MIYKNLSTFLNNQIPLEQEWKLPIPNELLKVKEDNFVLNKFV